MWIRPSEISWRAQRRPGPRPRRHRGVGRRVVDEEPRSTKAGAETPANRSTKAGAETPATRSNLAGVTLSYNSRSTKAGAETPATRLQVSGQRVDYQGRSTKAGAETPATRCGGQGSELSGAALNEGRGRDPGDTANRRRTTRKPVCRRLTAILTTGSARVWVWMPSQTRRCPRNLRRITTLSQAALESPGVRSFPVRAPKARRARASQSGQTGSELRKCDP